MFSSDPSCNTDQGVQHLCESKGGKPGGVMKVKQVGNLSCAWGVAIFLSTHFVAPSTDHKLR